MTGDDAHSLLASMREMVDMLKNFAAAQDEMARQHELGMIDDIMPVDRFPGVYGRMANSINVLVQSHIAVKMRVVEVVKRYAEGDLSVDMDRLPGKKAQITGSTEMPHSFAYIEDVGNAAAALGMHDAALGRVWIAPHAPARTQGEMVQEACGVLGVEARVSAVSPLMMRMAGLFVPAARVSVEMMYEFTVPFVVDSARIERELGLSATSTRVAMERTIAWYRERLARS